MTDVRPRTEWQKLVDSKLRDHDKRLSDAEKEYAVYQALSEERRLHMDSRFNSLEMALGQTKKDLTSDISGIKSLISRIAWLIIAAILVAAMNFALGGGFKLLSAATS